MFPRMVHRNTSSGSGSWIAPISHPKHSSLRTRNGGLLDPGNYRSRVLKSLAEVLELPKLTFQVLRRTRATCAQTSVKDIQAHLRHSRADTTANEYVQEFPRNVHHVVGTICAIPTSTATPQLIM